jgi:transposase
VLVSKYADHVPLYRQAQFCARQDIKLDRSTLADWVGRTAWYLGLLRDQTLEDLWRSERLFADETTASVLDPGPEGRRPASYVPMPAMIGHGVVED